MSHYPNWIKRYGSARGFTIGIREAMHIPWINNFFKRTNMKKGYEKQILDHKVKKFCLIVRADLDMFTSAETLTQANQNAALQVNSVSGAKNIMEDLKWHLRKDEC